MDNLKPRAKYRVKQDLADIVGQFNQLMKQRRFAEAEIKAKQAKDIAPNQPVTKVMKWKSRISRRSEFNKELQDRKERGFINQLNSVEVSAIGFDDRMPYQFPKDWQEITVRRRGKFGVANRSWSYLTTPVAMRPDEASAWTNLAKKLASQGSVEMASRAYETAFEQEATNAHILCDHSKYLKKQGRALEASELLNRLANGKWQPRFRNLQKRARSEVDSK